MPIWVDGCSVMRSPIAESGRSGDTTNIIALSRVPGNPGWTDDPCVVVNFMGDIDQNQSQPQQTHDVANETVVEQNDAENIASQLHNNNVYIMNKGEWTNKEKLKIVQINREKRQKGKNVMKKIKQRWDIEFPQKKRTTQNLVDNARRFEKGILRPGGGANIQSQRIIGWTTEMKIKLVKIDDEEQSKGFHDSDGFMKRVKERWDFEFLELASVSMHNLRNNAPRFQKETEIRNLILVRNRNKIDQPEDRVYEDPENHQITFEHEVEKDSTHGT